MERNADRYDLQYRTAADDKLREQHRAMNGITLPSTDPFWKYYYPPNGWNCRCTAVQVLRDKYPAWDPVVAMQAGDKATGSPKQRIFRFNPGIDKQLFPPKHPYYKLSKQEAEKVKETVKQLLETDPKPDPDTGVDLIRLRQRRREIKEEAKILLTQQFSNTNFEKSITISKTGIKEWLNQPHKFVEVKNEMLLDIAYIMQHSKYCGYGVDKHNTSVKAHIFEVTIENESSWIIVREYYNGECHIHSISDNANILTHIQNKPPKE